MGTEQQNKNGTKNWKPTYTPPAAPADLTNPDDREVWLDLVTSAIKGFCGASWAKDKGPIQMVSSSVAVKAAVEVADGVLAEFKKRCEKKGVDYPLR
jgi:hypothetical protein